MKKFIVRFRDSELKALETVWIRTLNDYNKKLNENITPQDLTLDAFVEVQLKALIDMRYNEIMGKAIKELTK